MDSAIHYAFVPSPVGQLLATIEREHLTRLFLPGHKRGQAPEAAWQPADDGDERFAELHRQLDEYFAGRRRQFDLPLAMTGTPFQSRVWRELVRIDFGTTITYAELAARIGQPSAARAVGLANSRNPISIVVPCHRVIGAGGRLTGYAGGLDTKRWLLDFEGSAARASFAGSDREAVAT